jgi:hypothetical protein
MTRCAFAEAAEGVEEHIDSLLGVAATGVEHDPPIIGDPVSGEEFSPLVSPCLRPGRGGEAGDLGPIRDQLGGDGDPAAAVDLDRRRRRGRHRVAAVVEAHDVPPERALEESEHRR